MDKTMLLLITLGIPFLGTILGSCMVFFMRKKMGKKLNRVLSGFAAGVMIAASVWSLLIPATDMAKEQGKIVWLPAAIGFLAGIAFLLILDKIIPHLHANKSEAEGPKTKLKNFTMLVLAVTLHNIPEGMAVGVIIAGALNGGVGVTVAGAISLAVGIAIQNFPEGAIISMPLRAEGESKGKAFLYGALSGIVEPVAGIITIALTSLITGTLPYLLAFAAGSMMYVVADELIPEAEDGHTDVGTIGLAVGFVIMMILDIALG